MKIVIVVDANIILSALLGGKPSIILFDSRFQFVTTKFTIDEVKKYLPKFARKLDASQKELTLLLEQLPLIIYDKKFYRLEIRKAKEMIGHFDRNDIEILALVLKLDTYLWSQDKDFAKTSYKKLLKTYDFLQ